VKEAVIQMIAEV
jgi:hypothetical protein